MWSKKNGWSGVGGKKMEKWKNGEEGEEGEIGCSQCNKKRQSSLTIIRIRISLVHVVKLATLILKRCFSVMAHSHNTDSKTVFYSDGS